MLATPRQSPSSGSRQADVWDAVHKALLPDDKEMRGRLAREHHKQAPDLGNDVRSRGMAEGRRAQFQEWELHAYNGGEEHLCPPWPSSLG